MTGPARTWGPTEVRRNSNSVTMPKFPPAPRTPQNRSLCSVALALSSSPSAVTRSTDSSWSIVRPYLRISHAMPPPMVDTARPAQPAPRLSPPRAVDRVDPHPLHQGEVDHQPVVAHRQAGKAVASASDSAREPNTASTAGGS